MTTNSPALPDTEPQVDPEQTLADIRAKSRLIRHLRTRRDAGRFRSVSDALVLQRAERDRERLQSQLPPLRLITTTE